MTGCGQVNTRIVGGEDATENQFPWMCSIFKSDGSWYGCGATIINCDPVIIVSAAHCFLNGNDVPRGKKIGCGIHNLYEYGANEESLSITEIIKHPYYNQVTNDNDIAVIKVSGTFNCRERTIYPACLPTDDYDYAGWDDTIVSGWGHTSEGGDVPANGILQWVKVPTVSNAVCSQVYPFQPSNPYKPSLTSNMICAGLEEGGKDSCQGDSGGPLVTRATGSGGDTGYTLAGVVSWGAGCASPGKYGVYARVSKYLGWIAQRFGLTLVA